jgi:hypothetical protein
MGKSNVEYAFSDYFCRRGAARLLLKTAYTGFAASLIQGNTCRSSVLISRWHDAVDNEVKKKLQHA